MSVFQILFSLVPMFPADNLSKKPGMFVLLSILCHETLLTKLIPNFPLTKDNTRLNK